MPGSYAPPKGALWLATVDGELAGCVGFRPHDGAGACEMKRLWLRPAYRKLGLGRRLAVTCIEAARAAGYCTLCLDTLGFMDAARALYTSLGFHEIPAYYHNSPLKKASLTGFHATAKHIAAKAVSPSSETMRTI